MNSITRLTKNFMKKIPRFVWIILSISLWVIVWALASFLIGNRFFLPSPLQTIIALYELVITAEFYKVVMLSLLRVLIGLLLGVLLGVALGVLCYRFPLITNFISLPMSVIKATPVASVILVLWVLLHGNSLAILVAVMMILPIIWQNTKDGFSSLDVQLIEVCTVYGLSFKDRFRVLYLPVIHRFIYPAVITSVGLAWKAEIATEIIAYTKNSIGQNINDAKTALLTPTVFAWTLVIILFSILLEIIARRLLRRVK